jgi:alkylation response protein AidB-like acyl-CoA dehydrogenase
VGIAQAALKETAGFLRTGSAPGEGSKMEDALTIYQFGELQCRLHAAEALMERAAEAIDQANTSPGYESVISAAITVAEAKVASTEVAMSATNQLFELVGPESLRERYGLDRHWRNARVHTLHDPVRWKYYAIGNYYLNGVDPPRHAWI